MSRGVSIAYRNAGGGVWGSNPPTRYPSQKSQERISHLSLLLFPGLPIERSWSTLGY
jgi:hypothetical protein